MASQVKPLWGTVESSTLAAAVEAESDTPKLSAMGGNGRSGSGRHGEKADAGTRSS